MPGPEKNQVKTVKSGAEASKALALKGLPRLTSSHCMCSNKNRTSAKDD